MQGCDFIQKLNIVAMVLKQTKKKGSKSELWRKNSVEVEPYQKKKSVG